MVGVVLDRLDLQPVVAVLLVVLVGLRLLLSLSFLRWPRHRARKAPGFRDSIMEWLDSGLITIALLFLIVRPLVAELADVTAATMEPTLRGSLTPQIDGVNDRVLVNKYIYHCRPPRRGEVVAVWPADPRAPGPQFVRVLGLPGDEVAVNSRGLVELNGRELRESYTRSVALVVFPPQRVPPGMLFVLGDWRDHDRQGLRPTEHPLLPLHRLRGQAVAILWPPDRMRLLRRPTFRRGVAPSRARIPAR